MPRGGPWGVALKDKGNKGELREAGFVVSRRWGARLPAPVGGCDWLV